MKTYTKIKQRVKNYVRHSPRLGALLSRYLKYKTTRESLPELLQESRRLYAILEKKKINVVLDVGANNGATGIRLRDRGYLNRIISFEPIPEIFAELNEWTKLAPPWECHKFALGNENGFKKFNILGNKSASSFLESDDVLLRELENFGGGHKEREELVEIKRLDDLFHSLCKPGDSILLKIDTQGFEKQVLEGAQRSLKHIQLVKMEAALAPVYKNEILMDEMIRYMRSKNFIPILIEVGHVSQHTLYQMQTDILFANLESDNQCPKT